MPKEVYCTPAEFVAFQNDPAFHQLLALARITNTVRFAHGAVVNIERDMTPAEERQLFSSFLYLAALLFEGLRLTGTLGKHFKDSTAFRQGFAKLHSDPEVEDLRSNALDKIRNKTVFHMDSNVIPEGLAFLSDTKEYVFLSANSFANGEIYYRLADEAVIHFLVDAEAGTTLFTERFSAVLSRTTDLSIRFSSCADELITEYLISTGWRTRQ